MGWLARACALGGTPELLSAGVAGLWSSLALLALALRLPWRAQVSLPLGCSQSTGPRASMLNRMTEGTKAACLPENPPQVQFTCNLCGTRNVKETNPHAWKSGSVFMRCDGCDVVHKMKVGAARVWCHSFLGRRVLPVLCNTKVKVGADRVW